MKTERDESSTKRWRLKHQIEANQVKCAKLLVLAIFCICFFGFEQKILSRYAEMCRDSSWIDRPAPGPLVYNNTTHNYTVLPSNNTWRFYNGEPNHTWIVIFASLFMVSIPTAMISMYLAMMYGIKVEQKQKELDAFCNFDYNQTMEDWEK